MPRLQGTVHHASVVIGRTGGSVRKGVKVMTREAVIVKNLIADNGEGSPVVT